MPIFEYKCEKCNKVFEHYTPSFEKNSTQCPDCLSQSTRLDKVYPVGVNFAGTGWYKDGY